MPALAACLAFGFHVAVAQPPGTPQQDIQRAQEEYSALELYQYRLLQTGARLRSYPPEAVAQRLEGTASVELIIAGNGTLTRATLTGSSGYVLLDAHALDLLAQAVPLTQTPSALQNRRFAVRVVIAFRLPD